MKYKRIIAVLLAFCAVFASSPSAFAAAGVFEPRNVLVSPVNGATGLAVSFTNPSTTTLTDVRVFNITDGQNSEILGSILKNPNDVNRIKVMSLKSGKPYYFKLVFAFSGGSSTEYITYGIPSNLMTEQVPTGWNVNYNYADSSSDWQYLPAWMSLDHETYHGGNTSLKIVSNQPESTVGNLYFFLTQGGFPSGANYEMTMWLKRLDVTTSAVKVAMGWLSPWETDAWDTWLPPKTNDWAKMTLHFGDTGNNELEFFCERFIGSMWIDDLEVRQMLPGGALGENILTNPGFELGTTPPNNVTSPSAVPGSNQVELSWTNPSSENLKKTNVYIIDSGKLIKRAEIGNDSNRVTIGALENDKEYEFVLKASDALGNEADGITVKATTISPPYDITEFKLYSAGNPIDNLTSGTLSLGMNVVNNRMGSDFKATLVCVLYDGKKIIGITGDTLTVPQTGISTPLSALVNVPASAPADEYKLETFLWDSVGGMNILRPYKIFN